MIPSLSTLTPSLTCATVRQHVRYMTEDARLGDEGLAVLNIGYGLGIVRLLPQG